MLHKEEIKLGDFSRDKDQYTRDRLDRNGHGLADGWYLPCAERPVRNQKYRSLYHYFQYHHLYADAAASDQAAEILKDERGNAA